MTAATRGLPQQDKVANPLGNKTCTAPTSRQPTSLLRNTGQLVFINLAFFGFGFKVEGLEFRVCG